MKAVSILRGLLIVSGAAVLGLSAGADSAYRSQIELWRQQHELALKSDGGWLTVTGLFWLKSGINSLGSDPVNDILLPEGSPARLGTVKVDGDSAFFTAAGDSVTLNGKPVSQAPLHYAAPVDTLSSGALNLFLLKRGERLALRVKDKNSVLRRRFTHLSWFPIQEEWRITGKFIPLPASTKLVFDTIIGEQETSPSPGYVEFQRDGQTYRLQAAGQGKGLFFVIRDRTSGKTTYSASRFLYAAPPAADGTVVLDFNKAENPPCAFTPYATCPLPPQQNRLPLAIEAGEQKYEGSAH